MKKNLSATDGLFSDKLFNKELIRLGVPIALQNLMLALVAAADALMLGNIRQDAMSAVSLATQIQFVQNMILFATVSAISILAAQYWGKGDKRTCIDILGIGLKINTVACIITFIGCRYYPVYLMRIFTNEPILMNIGVRYLKIASWSYLICGISQCYLCIFKVAGRAVGAAIISSSTVVINILLNAVFIFGLFGAPKMEERGAATATVIARVIEVAWCLILSFTPKYVRPNIACFIRHNRLLWADFIKCALPMYASLLLWGVGFTSYSAFMGHLGRDAAAANSVAAVVRDIVCCLCNGLGSAGSILIGYRLGRGDLQSGKRDGIKLCKISFICGGASTVIMLLLTPPILGFVDLTEKATELLLWMMIIMAFYMIGRAVNTIIINGIFYAGGDTLFDAYSLVVTMWCMAIPLAALGTFVFDWSPLVVYGMTCLDEVGKIPWVMYHFKKYKWVKDLTR